MEGDNTVLVIVTVVEDVVLISWCWVKRIRLIWSLMGFV